MTRFPRWLLTALLVASGLAGPAAAHGDEDHSATAKPVAVGPAAGPSGGEAAEAAGRQPDGSLFVPKVLQRRLGLRTVAVRGQALSGSVELSGTVIADPETGGRVQAPFAGSVLPGPGGMPVAGRRVVRGEVLVQLRPIASTIERANQRAQVAELEAQLAIADARVRRLEQLEGAVARKEIEAARIERSALQQRRNLVAGGVDGTEPLRAPASGVISDAHQLQAGQMVDARELLFEIVDPTRLAVEALAYEPGIAATLQGASALVDGATLALRFVGGGRQLRGQALPLLFRVATRDAAVAVGQPVKVVVRTDGKLQGHAVPRQALVRAGAGETAVWVHEAAERFVLRRVHSQPLDAGQVAVTAGLEDGDRVVVAGASLLSQVR